MLCGMLCLVFVCRSPSTLLPCSLPVLPGKALAFDKVFECTYTISISTTEAQRLDRIVCQYPQRGNTVAVQALENDSTRKRRDMPEAPDVVAGTVVDGQLLVVAEETDGRNYGCHPARRDQPVSQLAETVSLRIVMREIRIDAFVQRKSGRISIQSRIGLGLIRHRRPGETGDKLIDEADALHRAERVPIASIVVFLKILSVVQSGYLLSLR